AARQFFLALNGQSRFARLELLPLAGKSHVMLRDDGSRTLTQAEEYFELSTLMSPYRKQEWPEGAGAYAAIWLGEDEAQLNVGAFFAQDLRDLAYAYGYSDGVEPSEIQSLPLRNAEDAALP